MAAVARSPITACSNVRDPVPPADASSADVARLRELCDLACKRHTVQTGKDTLELRAKQAGMGNSAYYTERTKGRQTKKRIKNKEFLVAHILVAEGRESAVPAGWYKAAPEGVMELPSFAAMPAAPQPVVYEVPSVPPPDTEAVQAAKAYFDQALSYRDMTETGQYDMHKKVLEDSALVGERFASSTDALTALMELKQNIRGLSQEDKDLFAVLLKPCMDISMWKGYDAADHSKNAAYYEIWYKRLVAAGATIKDTFNKYQEYCRQTYHRDAVPVKSCKDLQAFYDWFVIRVEENDTGEQVVGRSWKHIASMVYFHGYVTPEEWREGGFPDPNSHYTFKQDTTRAAKANGKRKAITGEDGYDCGDRGWLSQEEIKQISDLLWDKQADDAILFHQFASIATQTMIRPEELLQLRRRNTWLSESSDYTAKSGPVKLIEILSKGANKNSKTSRLLSWVVRNRELDHLCPWFWMAARLMHDYQRLLPDKEGGLYGSMVQVFQDRPKVVMHRRTPSNPLTQRIRSEESVCCMLPLLSERKFSRVGSGPMNSAFHTSTHTLFNKRILHPAFAKLGIVERMKGCATRVLRASTMCRLWHNEVPKDHTKTLSKHDNKDAVDTFYNLKCPGNSLKTILRAAGFHMQEGDSWKDVFVQGRGLYTLQRIQQERPDVWEIISVELVPGLEAWVASVKSRDSSDLPAFERVNGYQALLQWELLAAFLQDSAHHFFEHRDSPVFLDLPVFQNPIFTDWLLRDFRQQILQLQLMADVCYKHVTNRRKETTMLQTVSSERSPPISAADSQSMLEDVYSRIMQDTDATAQTYRQQAEQQAAARVAMEEAAAGSKHARDPGVVTMPLGSNLTLRKLWDAWEPQKPGQGCDGLRIYKAESPSLYPSDEPRRQQMRWLRQGDGNRFDQFRQVFLTLDRLVRRKDTCNRKRDAETVTKAWERSLFSAPQCPINTVAGLAVALKDYANGKQLISGASGGQKRTADGQVVKQLTRERLEFFFQLV